MKTKILTIILSLLAFQSIMAQQSETKPTPQTEIKPTIKEANPADVASIDAIMKAVYDVISGDAGQKRDWDRFRSLFYKDAAADSVRQKSDDRRNRRTFTFGGRLRYPRLGEYGKGRFFTSANWRVRPMFTAISRRFSRLINRSTKKMTKRLSCAASTVFSF